MPTRSEGEPGKTLLQSAPIMGRPDTKLKQDVPSAANVAEQPTSKKFGSIGDFLDFDDFKLGDNFLHFYFLKEQFQSFPIEDADLVMLAATLQGKLGLVTLTAVPEAFIVKGFTGKVAHVQTFLNGQWPKDLLVAIEDVTPNIGSIVSVAEV